MKQILVPATRESHGKVTEFVERILEEEGCPEAERMKLLIVLDELFGNIANYSGASQAAVECGRQNENFLLRLKDDGAAFNPLQQGEPDITGGADERAIGGLGIFLVKKNVTDIQYERQEPYNILTVVKGVGK